MDCIMKIKNVKHHGPPEPFVRFFLIRPFDNTCEVLEPPLLKFQALIDEEDKLEAEVNDIKADFKREIDTICKSVQPKVSDVLMELRNLKI